MAHEMQVFQYTPLKGARHIRVLVLEPARKTSDPVHCSFKEISLDDEATVTTTTPYEALSYTWGAPKGTRPIFCHGSTILVTPNCEQALLHLRNKSKPRNMWIDAICINQESIDEKNQQVPLMGDIYRAATRAVLWLGPSTDPELSAVLRNACRYGSAVNGVTRLFRKVKKSDLDFDSGESNWRAAILPVTESEMIAQLCANQWFSRVWTIQEFLLAKTAIFLMGDVECPTLDLYTYYRLGKDLVKRADLEHYRTRNLLAEASTGVTRVSAFKRLMILVLELTALSNASDARDKVYGMNAYLKSVLSHVELPAVDYANSLQEVYEDFTRFLMEVTGNLWALEFLGTHKPGASDMPSWVVDLRDADRLASLWNRSWVQESTSHPTLPESKYTDFGLPCTSGELFLRAESIAEVALVSSRMPYWDSSTMKTSTKTMDDARTACLSEWTAFVTNIDMTIVDPADNPYVSEKYIKEPYAQTLKTFTSELDYLRLRHEAKDDVSDRSFKIASERARKVKLKERERQIKEAFEDSLAYDDDVRAHDMSVLFLMSDGHLAETQGDVRVGDDICIVEGSRYPLLLRHREGGRYVLIGKVAILTDKKVDAWNPAKLSEDPDPWRIILT